MSEDLDMDYLYSDADARMYESALARISSGIYDPKSIKLVRKGVFEGYLPWRKATRAAWTLLQNHPEVQIACECLDAVARGVAHDITVPWLMTYVMDGLIDEFIAQDTIAEGVLRQESMATIVTLDSAVSVARN
jgi:hypothetical protein